jgi:nicotinate-nucleotide adenylyltransferase
MGHLKIAEEARRQLGLDWVLFVPAGRPALKTDRIITPAHHRIQMVRLAIAGKHYFELSALEVDRPGVSYTVDTLASLQKQFGAEAKLFFIAGMDSLLELPEWREAVRLVNICRLVVFPRAGYKKPDLKAMEASIIGLAKSMALLDMEPVDISSTDIRRRVAQGMSIHGLVPAAVERYIKAHRLYR